MPGKKDPLIERYDYLTNFALHRTVTTNDANAAAVTEIINLSASVSAQRNRVQIYTERTSGTGTIAIDVYAKLNGSLDGIWHKVATVAAADDKILTTVSNLPGAELKLVCTLSAAATWNLHVAHSDNSGHA